MIAPLGKQAPQLVLPLQRSGELGHVFLPHAGCPLEVVGPIGGDPCNHQHGCGCLQTSGTSEGMSTATGPSGHQATLSTDRSQHGPGVGDHVNYAAAGVAG